MDKFVKLFSGITLTALGIACVLNSCLGAFSITAANIAISEWLNVPLAIANMLVELTMLGYATYKGEGIGIAAIANATYGSIMIDAFHLLLPTSKFMVLGIVLLPIGNSLIGNAGMGDTGTNILTNVMLKSTKQSVSIIRVIIDTVMLVIGWLGARDYVSWFTVIITFGFGPLMQAIYKLVGYKPADVKHSFIIGYKKIRD